MMKTIKVILKQRLKNCGAPGDCVSVKRGYARNFLFPSGAALPMTQENLSRLEAIKQEALVQEQNLHSWALSVSEKLRGLILTIRMRSTAEGKLYGSVTTRHIADALKSEHQIEVPAHQILLFDPIRQVGEYKLVIELHDSVKSEILVQIHSVLEE